MFARLVVLLAITSCKSNDTSPPATTQEDCERVVARIEEFDRTKSTSQTDAKDSPLLLDVVGESLKRRAKMLLEHCVADRWPQTMITCVMNAKDFAQSEKCSPLLDEVLTQAQIQALNKDYEAIETWVVETARKRVDAQLVAIKHLRDRMCACTVDGCRSAVGRELSGLKRPTDLVVKKVFDELETALTACRK